MSLPQEPRISDAAAPNKPSALNRFFGGRPLVVLFRLALLSVLVGFNSQGTRPSIRSISSAASASCSRAIWDMGYEAFERLWRYFVLGAVLVVPIWLIVRLVRAPRGTLVPPIEVPTPPTASSIRNFKSKSGTSNSWTLVWLLDLTFL